MLAMAGCGGAGGLDHAREYHSATALADGSILIAGGDGPHECVRWDDHPHGGCMEVRRPTEVADAERFDPRERRSARAGRLREARYSHSATLLPDGRVLLAGGWRDGPGALGSCEVWLPGRGFAAAAPMHEARGSHLAVLVAGGRVLVVGGQGAAGDAVASAELYDPGADRWTLLPPMAVARLSHSATTLRDGRVLVVGGKTKSGDNGEFHRSAELFDPARPADGWRAVGDLAAVRIDHSATLLPDGRVLVAGGTTVLPDGVLRATTSAELFDPAVLRFAAAPALAVARTYHEAALQPGGFVLLIGGTGFDYGMLRDAELYSPARGGVRIRGIKVWGAGVLPAARGGAWVLGGTRGDFSDPTARADFVAP